MFLVDCGEGTQIQMNRFKIRRSRIHHIIISHLHGDHYFGLSGLLNSYSLTSRQDSLHLYAPAPLREILDLQFKAAATTLSYPLHFHALEEAGLLVDDRKISVECFPVHHRIPCWGFRFREKLKPRKIDPRMAYQAGIPPEFFPLLKEGEDFVRKDGTIVPNAEVTKPAPKAVSYAYCADTRYEEKILPYIQEADLVYHEATYLEDQRAKAIERYHSTAQQAATIALKARARRLLLGHFSSKYEELDAFREEAEQVFPDVEVCKEGVTYIVK
jgi:ribonuclease Z